MRSRAARRHLRDAATICTAELRLSSGYVLGRCELDAGHREQHKSGCSRWHTGDTETNSSGGGSRG